MTTAMISYKKCRECDAEAPVFDALNHTAACSGSPNICDVVQREHELQAGDEVVTIPLPHSDDLQTGDDVTTLTIPLQA